MEHTFRHRIASASGLVLVIAGILLVTVAADRLLTGWRIDLTERSIHTLSPATRELLAALETDVELRFYFSAGQAQRVPQLRNHARYVETFLREFEAAANGRIRLQVIDPEPFSDAEDEAAAAGLQAVPLGVPGEVLYFGLEGRSDHRRDVIRFFPLDRERFLEYEIARLVHTLARQREPRVGLVSSLPVTGGFDPGTGRSQPAWTSISQLQQLFEVSELDPDEADSLDDVDVLLVIHPHELGMGARLAIDQFVLAGGPALVFVDPHAESMEAAGMFPGGGTESDLPVLLEAWGLRLIPDRVVLDADRALAVSMGPGTGPVRHLAIPGYGLEDFAGDEVVTAQLEQVVFASAGALEPLESATTGFMPLISSTNNSALVPTEQVRFLSDPRQLARGFDPDGERHVLAARITGPARSAFAHRGESPAGEQDPDGPHDDGPPAPAPDLEEGDIQVVVVADTDVLSDPLWVTHQTFFDRQIPVPWASNGDLLVNTIDQLAGGSQLIGIRGRAGIHRPFSRVETLQRQAEARFLRTEETLRRRLEETEIRLAELEQQRMETAVDALTLEQLDALQAFQAEQVRIRRELRAVQRQLTEDIDRLGNRLKLLNILAVPTFLVLAAMLLALHRRRRRRQGIRIDDLESRTWI